MVKKQIQINSLVLYLKERQREEKYKLKVSKKKKTTKVRAEIRDIETKKTMEKINKTKSCFYKDKTEKKKKNIQLG